ncbi:stage III sporulation protein AF [Halobacillus litoralis]|uniref:stage III sporulation protein AF n=1 Tax=Halobacillus litoralis TaxID=45668 RepID=UPI001CD37543|nr:stage III sporulation protein AF [Halobacillus litoralis]MCA0970123.1 stage III sporulation protein AF [Halobacillus litoralis]
MNWFIEWITQIVLFLLLAMVADTLLPSGLMKKYARLVMSILLLLIFLGPLLDVLSIDPEEIMNAADEQMNQQVNADLVEDEIEKKKSEILEGQGAYKLEQVTQSLQAELENPLKEELDLQLIGVEMSFLNETYDMETLDRLMITVSRDMTTEQVKEVDVSFEDKPDDPNKEVTERVKSWVADYVGLEKDKIEIRWEEEDE